MKNTFLSFCIVVGFWGGISCQKEGSITKEAQGIVLELQAWTAHPADVVDARFGEFFAGGIDVNGDGYSDVIAAAPQWADADGGQPNEGRIYLFLGSERGLPSIPSWFSDPVNVTDARFGPIAALGDVNGDGFGDFAVLARTTGQIYMYFGNAAATYPQEVPVFASLGSTILAEAGDVNGDGYADMIAGSPNYSGNAEGEGRVIIYLGGADGIGEKSISLDPTDQLNAHFGSALGSAGDVNGDGFGDLIIGASEFDAEVENEGRVYLYLGGADEMKLAWSFDPTNQTGSGFGSSVAGAGDVDGDGFADILIGSPGFGDTVLGRGKVFLLKGGLAESSLNEDTQVTLTSVDQAGAAFGFSVSGAGDVNGDGYADIIVGAPDYDPSPLLIDVGRMMLFLGGPLGLDSEVGGEAVAALDVGARLGSNVRSVGDVNGDGLSDVVGNAMVASGGVANEGMLLGYYGALPQNGDDVLPPRERQYGQSSLKGELVLRNGIVDDGGIVLSAHLIQENNLGGKLQLEVEVKPLLTPFDGLELLRSDAIASGGVAEVSVVGLSPGQYHWRARTIFPVGNGQTSWFEFDEIGPLNPVDPNAPVIDPNAPVDPNAPLESDFEVKEAVIVVPPKPGYYDCQIAPAGSRSQHNGTVLLLFLGCIGVLRSVAKRR